MNKKLKVASSVAFGAIVMTLAACGPEEPQPGSSDTGTGSSSSSVVEDSSSSSSSAEVKLPVATGAYQFVDRSYEDRTEILGKLEKYAVDNALTGLPLYENGGYQIYNRRIVKGTENYVKNYGFSTLRDGYIREGMGITGETDGRYQNYYHNYTSEDPASLNAWNTDGSLIGDFAADSSTSYFGTKLNAEKDGYEWYGILSKDDHMLAVENGKVVPVANSGELHNTWRMHVRTGEEGRVTYRTASNIENRKAFDGTYVTLEDYITTFKMLLNGANRLYRGTEMASKTGKGTLAGMANYYQTTASLGVTGVNESPAAEAAFEKVGIKSGTDEAGDYLEFTFTTPINRFFAMYNINSNLYQPLPKAFIETVGVANINGYDSTKSTSPVDNTLSVGPYFIESWETDVLITYKRNDAWFERLDNPNLYRMGGIHTKVLAAVKSDENAAFNEFLLGHLDACSVPRDFLNQYATDPRTVKVPGDSVWKLNINSCTEELWEQLFGVDGTIAQTKMSDYWNVKPWMSNNNFIRGLFYSIDRGTYAKARGAQPSIDYFSSAYLSDPENGVSYSDTQAHKDALTDFWGDTVDTYGYSAALSQEAFKAAINDLLDEGAINSSTKEISIDIWWMAESQVTVDGAQLGGYISSAFNAAATSLGLPVRLVVNNYAPEESMDVYYEHLMVGQFDLGFGSISGNPLDPLNFMEVLKSSNTSGFTLNWGNDTSVLGEGDSSLVFEDERWTFDGLWDAADGGAILGEDGQSLEGASIEVTTAEVVDSTKVHIAGKVDAMSFDGLDIEPVAIFGTTNGDYTDYFEVHPGVGKASLSVAGIESCSWNDDGTFDIVMTDELAANAIEMGGFPLFGVDYDQTIKGVYCGLKSAYTRCPIA